MVRNHCQEFHPTKVTGLVVMMVKDLVRPQLPISGEADLTSIEGALNTGERIVWLDLDDAKHRQGSDLPSLLFHPRNNKNSLLMSDCVY